MTLILDVKGLSKGFEMHHLGTRMAAFSDISFNLSAGEFLLLKGRNGAGKSTLLRTLYRSYLAASGQILFHSSHGVVDLARAALDDLPNVDVVPFTGLVVDFATEFGVTVLVRGVRSVSDFDYEKQMAVMNRYLSESVDTVMLAPSTVIATGIDM